MVKPTFGFFGTQKIQSAQTARFVPVGQVAQKSAVLKVLERLLPPFTVQE